MVLAQHLDDEVVTLLELVEGVEYAHGGKARVSGKDAVGGLATYRKRGALQVPGPLLKYLVARSVIDGDLVQVELWYGNRTHDPIAEDVKEREVLVLPNGLLRRVKRVGHDGLTGEQPLVVVVGPLPLYAEVVLRKGRDGLLLIPGDLGLGLLVGKVAYIGI